MSLMKRKRRYRWVWRFLLVGVTVGGIWLLLPRESKAQRLKAELESRGERFTFEALGFGVSTNEDPAWFDLEAAVDHFEALSDARVDAARGVEPDQIRAQPPQIGWQQPFLYSCRYSDVLE
jgi:hypothetical protein